MLVTGWPCEDQPQPRGNKLVAIHVWTHGAKTRPENKAVLSVRYSPLEVWGRGEAKGQHEPTSRLENWGVVLWLLGRNVGRLSGVIAILMHHDDVFHVQTSSHSLQPCSQSPLLRSP